MTSISQILKTTFRAIGKPFLAFGRWLRRKVASLRNVQPRHTTSVDHQNNVTTSIQDRHISRDDNSQPDSSSSISISSGHTENGGAAYNEAEVSQLLTDMGSSGDYQIFCNPLMHLAQQLPRGEIREVVYSACQNVANKCLSQDRLQHYKLSILLSRDITDQHKPALIHALQQQSTTPNPPIDPHNDIRESEWSREYHAYMQLLSNAINERRQACAAARYPFTQTLCSIDELNAHFAQIAPPTDDPYTYDVSLTAVFHFLDQLDRALDRLNAPQKHQIWIRNEVNRLKLQLSEKSCTRLPYVYQHDLTHDWIDADAVGLGEDSTEDWKGVLRDVNRFAAFGQQFDKDRTRDHYIIRNEISGSINCYSPGSKPLTDEDLTTLCGSRLIAGTLSKIINQTFYSYMIKLEAARLSKLSPWLIFVQSNDQNTIQQYTITLKENGAVTVETEMKSDKPTCLLDQAVKYLEGAEYSLSCETTFDGAQLKQGILSAPKPVVRMKYPATDTIQWHDHNGI